ncbi:C-terminal binding protein [Natrarchaeobius halalkaliphilus]|uniref:C-terminal binding protein n=1 Tax=Natrarchaeobius halalkaliphilus TaxID=1679091 RepID=A0A3N6LZ91_9EURY|nr:C-terminal binding protein [Natrarchaeobius halalkaliphilus]RQG88053.1 C-terminal binding protein [Natrarchaeobius halalkaliphilus]
MSRTVRIVHLDPDWFGDVEQERRAFEREFDAVRVDAVDVPADASAGEIAREVGEADALLTHYTDVSGPLMDATGCSVVSRYATGIDGIDVEAATERGVKIANVPTYCDREVGEHVATLAMACLRGLPQYTSSTADGEWDWSAVDPVRSFSELSFGFLAFGNKARAAADIATAVGFECLAADPFLDDETIERAGVEPVEFDELIERCDVLSVNAPLTDETREIIDEDVLERMPDSSVLINTSRGELVDESALLDALEDGPLLSAGLDVLANEPPAETNPLLGRSDVFVTPHAAWYSERSVDELIEKGSEAVIAAYEEHQHEGIVNPETLE